MRVCRFLSIVFGLCLSVFLLSHCKDTSSSSNASSENEPFIVSNVPEGITLTDSNGQPVTSYDTGTTLVFVSDDGEVLFSFTADGNLDLGNVVVDQSDNKTLVYFPSETDKLGMVGLITLRVVGESADNAVIVCPHATALDEVDADCDDRIILSADSLTSGCYTLENPDREENESFQIICDISAFNGGALSTQVLDEFTIGGTVEGLVGTLVLQNNAGDDLTLTDEGLFVFSGALLDGSAYVVSVLSDPVEQTCTVSHAVGVVTGTDVTDVSVVCSVDSFNLGGVVDGLQGTLVLQNNGGDDLLITADGEFLFETALAAGAGYDVTVLTQPDGQTCTVTLGDGIVVDEDVMSVAVLCEDHVAPSITFNAITKSYGDAAFAVSPTSNSGGSFSYTSSNTGVATVSGSTVTIVGAGTTTLTATQAASGNYTSGSTTALLTVNAIAPSITFNAITKSYGDAAFAVSPTSNSGGSFSYTSSNTGVATVSGSTVTIVGAGTTTLTATQAASGNYTSGSTTALLTVNTIAPTLVFNDFEKIETDAAFTPTSTSNSAGAITYTSSNTSVATASGNTVTLVGFGTTTLTATQAASGNYTSASDTATMVVHPNLCVRMDPCLNGGTCATTPDGGYTCSCPEGYSGDTCELSTANCNDPSNFCLNGGECTPTPAGGECVCAPCFTGPRCNQFDVQCA